MRRGIRYNYFGGVILSLWSMTSVISVIVPSMDLCERSRHCRLSESKLLGLHVVDRMADYVTDDTRLQWLLPHTVVCAVGWVSGGGGLAVAWCISE